MNQERVELRAKARQAQVFCGIRSPIKRRIYDYLQRKGVDGATTPEIMDFVYMHDPDGGPESGNVISVHIRQMNLMLAQRGMKIRSTMGQGATYHLEELK
jgi:hypothetical protein